MSGSIRARISAGGTVKLAESKLGRSRVAGVNGRDDDDGSRPDLRWLSLPRGDHQLRGLETEELHSFLGSELHRNRCEIDEIGKENSGFGDPVGDHHFAT